MKVLAVFVHGPGVVFNTRRAIGQLADLHELRFRVGGGMISEIGKALGLEPTLRPATETYDLLSSGRFDGVFLPAETIASIELEMLVSHLTAVPERRFRPRRHGTHWRARAAPLHARLR